MEQKRTIGRGIEPDQQKMWIYSIQKENKLRLIWFKHNETRLQASADHRNSKIVAEDVRKDMDDKITASFQNVNRKAKYHVEDPPPPLIDENAINSIMRPVEKTMTDLIYSSTQNDGRVKYLKQREKIIPEQRYYFPETSNFNYGWSMWNCSKDKIGSKFARQQVIKESFYRRRGVERDPDWYREPAKLSPSVCGCI